MHPAQKLTNILLEKGGKIGLTKFVDKNDFPQ